MTDILLLHGAIGAATQMHPLAAAFGGRFRAHVLDFEGHGAAPPRDRPFRIDHFVENVLAYLDAAAIHSVPVFGYSMGGYVALRLAIAAPERVERIVTLATKFDWTPASAESETRMLDPNAIEAKVPAFASMLRQRHSAAGWNDVLARTSEMMIELGSHPVLNTAALAGIELPVRIAVGDRDRMVSIEESLAAFRAIPGSELQVLPGIPHPLEQIDPTRLAAAVAEFLEP